MSVLRDVSHLVQLLEDVRTELEKANKLYQQEFGTGDYPHLLALVERINRAIAELNEPQN